MTIYSNFWSYVDVSQPWECWDWERACDRDGYGKLKHGNEHLAAHREAWVREYGNIPHGLCVCHHCDNTRCCNPSHLFLGSHADNSHDRDKKGRGYSGDRHHCATITRIVADEIRELAGTAPNVQIASMFGVSTDIVSDIKNGRSWKSPDTPDTRVVLGPLYQDDEESDDD